MDFATFAAEVRKKPAAPLYVFAGPEALLRERGAALLRESDPDLAANAVRLASSDVDWPRLADELYTPPFFGKRKLVVLADEGNFVHNHADTLRAYAKEPAASAVLAALVPTEKVPAIGDARVVECRTPRAPELPRWLTSEAQRLGKSLDRASAELLA